MRLETVPAQNKRNFLQNTVWKAVVLVEEKTEKARRFYSAHPDTNYWPPVIVEEWITRANVNRVIQENGFGAEIDLLSLDVDGVDHDVVQSFNVVVPEPSTLALLGLGMLALAGRRR